MDKNYKKEFEKERTKNKFLVCASIILIIGLLVLSVKLYNKTQESENLCYMSNSLIDVVNEVSEYLETDFEKMNLLPCNSGNAERRLNG